MSSFPQIIGEQRKDQGKEPGITQSRNGIENPLRVVHIHYPTRIEILVQSRASPFNTAVKVCFLQELSVPWLHGGSTRSESRNGTIDNDLSEHQVGSEVILAL